jgi:L-asparaginase
MKATPRNNNFDEEKSSRPRYSSLSQFVNPEGLKRSSDIYADAEAGRFSDRTSFVQSVNSGTVKRQPSRAGRSSDNDDEGYVDESERFFSDRSSFVQSVNSGTNKKGMTSGSYRDSGTGRSAPASAQREDDDKVEISASQTSKNDYSKNIEDTTTPATTTSKRHSLVQRDDIPVHESVAKDAGPLFEEELCEEGDLCTVIPHRGRHRKRVLVLCTGGTLTMSADPTRGNSLAPVQGALTEYLAQMRELTDDPEMPEIIAHEYKPLIDSSDMGPGDWAMLARDIHTNYYHFDGFVILMGTDTMAYTASALAFMLQNLGKPVIFTGSQIPLREPYNDARKNLIMATIFASSDTVSEVCIFFHDRLLRGCRATKVNTSKLKAFDSPNLPSLAEIGINIEENEHLFRPPPRGSFKINTAMDTRMITLRLVPGFDDASIKAMVDAARQTHLKGLILQLYGTGNLPSLKDSFVQCLKDATDSGIVVVATTQCQTGSVILGHYATGQKLIGAGVVSASDMTIEATTTKLAYLLGRQDLSIDEVRDLMTVDLRGEMTPESEMPPPPLASTYQKVIAKKNRSRVY